MYLHILFSRSLLDLLEFTFDFSSSWNFFPTLKKKFLFCPCQDSFSVLILFDRLLPQTDIGCPSPGSSEFMFSIFFSRESLSINVFFQFLPSHALGYSLPSFDFVLKLLRHSPLPSPKPFSLHWLFPFTYKQAQLYKSFQGAIINKPGLKEPLIYLCHFY